MARGAFVVSRDSDNPRDIHFKLASGDLSDVPEDQASLRDEVDRTLSVLRVVFEDDDSRFERYFRPLLSLSQFGLVGPSAQPEIALRALSTLRTDVVAREGGRIKNRYMKDLAIRAVILGFPALIVALVGLKLAVLTPSAATFLFLWFGCMVGVWLSFGVRKKVLQFDDLHILEEDRLEPTIRLIFAGLLALTIGLLLVVGAITIQLGDVTTDEITRDPLIAILVGLFCGISEKALGTTVAGQASKLISA